jgi:hypothetical protein
MARAKSIVKYVCPFTVVVCVTLGILAVFGLVAWTDATVYSGVAYLPCLIRTTVQARARRARSDQTSSPDM